MPSEATPRGLDTNVTASEWVEELEAESIEWMLKRGWNEEGGSARRFVIFSDEPREALGGDDSAPHPLFYFTLGFLFCEMTQIARFGRMLKVDIGKVRGKVTARFLTEGSVKRGDRRGWLDEVQTELWVESDDDPDKVAEVVRIAKNGCFARQALRQPVEITREIVHVNDEPLDLPSSE